MIASAVTAIIGSKGSEIYEKRLTEQSICIPSGSGKNKNFDFYFVYL